MTPDALLAEAAWLKRLALSLAGDSDDADDLVQESWIAAWRRKPDTARSLRPWLGKVLRDQSRMLRRAGARRRHREEVTSEPHDVPAPDELLDQVRLHKLIVDLVLELDEPFRSTVLARYVDGQTSAAIAKRLNIPESTVRWRLHEALVRLRTRLDEINGERKAWAPAVLAFAGKGFEVAKATKTGMFAVALILLLLGAAGVWMIARSPTDHARRSHLAEGSGSVSAHGPEPTARAQATAPTWFVTPGVAAKRIAGHVLHRGSPVPNATVELASQLTRAGFASQLVARTDKDGAFDLGEQPAAEYDVTATSPGLTPAILHIDLSDPRLHADDLQLRLEDCSASVAGSVLDADGTPIPRAHVRRYGISGVDADDRGRYQICVPFSPGVEIEYSADGYGAVILTIDSRGAVRRDVVLVPEATLVVHVVRADDGKPVPGAVVFVNPKEWGADRASTRSAIADSEGRARITGELPGEVHVFGWTEGLESAGGREALVQVGVPTELTLRLETMARIEGKVVRGEAPVAGARVQAVRPSPVQRSAPAISQPDGTFVLDRVPVGALRFLAPPYEVDAPTAFTVEPGKIYRNVVLHLHALGAIRGRVTRLGQPVAGTEVCCAATNAGGPPRAITDANGHYEFVGVAKGTYEIGGGGEAVGAFSLPRKIDLVDGEERTVDIELDQAATITGTVVDREHKPVQGVFVRWLNEKKGDVGRAITDDLGRYRCTTMTGGGLYRAAVFPSGAAFFASSEGTLDAYPPADGSDYPEVDLANGSSVVENMTIEIDYEQKTISGHVTDEVGAPVVDAIVKAMVMPEEQEPHFHVWLRLPVTSTDANGAFKISGLAPGKYAVQAHAIDGSEGITPNVSAGADDATVRVERAGAISGTLVSFAHTPAVYARTFGTYKYIPGTADGSTFTIAGVRPGRYFVSAQDADEGEAQIVDVKGGQTANVTLTSHGQGAVDATVVDFRTHQAVPGIGCHAIMSIGGEQGVTNWDPITSARSDDAGHLTIDPAPAGNISLDCQQLSGTPRSNPSADVTVSRGARASVQLLSVAQTQDIITSIGVEFDLRTTPPRIAGIRTGSSAARAGLAVGDLITDVNGTSTRGLNGAGVQVLIGNTPAGSNVRVTVLRGATPLTVTAKAEVN